MAVYTLLHGLVFTIGVSLLYNKADCFDARVFENASLSLTLSDPQDVIVAKGQSASFSCSPKSNLVPSIRWLYNGNAIGNDSRLQVHDNGTLTISKVSGKKVGTYQCYLKNDYGALLSSPATLRLAILGKEFSEQMEDITVEEGQPIVLPCRIHSFPKADVDWFRNNQPLPQTTRYVPLPSGSLLITNTHSSDINIYSCNVTNPILKNKPKESKKGVLKVIHPLKKQTPLKILDLGLDRNITVLVGEDVRLFCAVSGWPVPTIKWFKGKRFLPSANDSTIVLLKNITAQEAGVYTCTAQNGIDNVDQIYNVVVHQRPYFNHTMQSRTYSAPVTIRTPCHAFGIPKPKIYWLVNGTEFNFNIERKSFNNSQLSISKSISTDAGIYQCVAENSAGRSWLAVQYYSKNPPLPAPINMRCQPYNDTSICIRWDVPPNIEPNAFTVDSYNGEMGPDYLSNVTYYLAGRLSPKTEYSFISRLYKITASDNSNSVTCSTGTIGERNLKISRNDYNSVNLTWSSISSDFPCDLNSVRYRIQWRYLGANYSSVKYVNFKNSTIIKELDTGKTYEFRIASITTKSAFCNWVNFALPQNPNNNEKTKEIIKEGERYKQKENDPTIIDLHVNQQRANSVQLNWTCTNKNIVFFHICYFEAYSNKDCDQNDGIKHDKTVYDSVTIKNLKSSTVYEFYVRGIHENGTFTDGKIVESSTLTEGPVIVNDLKYRVVNSTTICVRWRAPYHKNGKYMKYTVRYSSQNGVENSVNVTALAKNNTPCWIDPSGTDHISVLLSQLDPDDTYKLFIEPEQNSNVTAPHPILFTINEQRTGKINSPKTGVGYDQKLGIAVGMSISLCAFVACAICLVRMVLKRRKTQSTNRNRTRFYVCEMRSTQTNHHQLGVSSEIQEMQNLLITGNGTGHIPAIPSTELDSKGNSDFPNKHLNGNANFGNKNPALVNVTTNGHIHILENPQFEDSNSNLSDSNLHTKILSHFGVNRNSKTISMESLNTTQLTYLDDSEIMQTSLRKVSSPLGPNG
ncbi:protogenin-like isoform X2 [Onthophagus taurus]|uniref:protogenin-like isoform X2 n=1 Tax=Onthophagus taurus TaxID=166361 RepID=UPI000C206A1D|nr:protogenin-like isoform X2 [Onthophagus taurus]